MQRELNNKKGSKVSSKKLTNSPPEEPYKRIGKKGDSKSTLPVVLFPSKKQAKKLKVVPSDDELDQSEGAGPLVDQTPSDQSEDDNDGNESVPGSSASAEDDNLVTSAGDRALAEVVGFPEEFLEQIARNCDEPVVETLINLFRHCVKRDEEITRLRRGLHTFGITSDQQDSAENSHRASVGAEPLPKRRKVSATSVVAVGTSRCERLGGKFSASQMSQFIAHLRDRGLRHVDDDRGELITPAARATITSVLLSKNFVSELEDEEWLEWDAIELADKLAKCFEDPDASIARSCVDWLSLMLNEAKLSLNIRRMNSYLSYVQAINSVNHEAVTKDSPVSMVIDQLLAHMVKGGSVTKANKTLHQRLTRVKSTLTSLQIFTNKIVTICIAARESIEEADQWEERQAVKDQTAGGKDQRQNWENSPSNDDNSSNQNRYNCNGCGNKDAKRPGNTCKKCVGHPDRNTSGLWQGCASFQALRDRLPKVPNPCLPTNTRANGDPLTAAEQATRDALKAKFKEYGSGKPFTGSQNAAGKKSKNYRGKSGRYLNNINTSVHTAQLVPCMIVIEPTICISVQALIDTGSLDDNYIGRHVLEGHKEKIQKFVGRCDLPADLSNHRCNVVLGGTESTIMSNRVVCFDIAFLSQISHSTEILSCLTFRELDTAFDLIIGLTTIRDYDLTLKLRSFFVNQKVLPTIDDGLKGSILTSEMSTLESPNLVQIASTPHKPISLPKNQLKIQSKTLPGSRDRAKSTRVSQLELDQVPLESAELKAPILGEQCLTLPNVRHTPQIPSDSRKLNIPPEISRLSMNCATSVPVLEFPTGGECSCRQPNSKTQYFEICNPCMELGMENLKPWWFSSQKLNKEASHQLCIITSAQDDPSGIVNPIIDSDDIMWKDDPFDFTIDEDPSIDNLLGKINIFGSAELQTNIHNLCREYIDIFSEAVRSEPARVPPMEIAVDKSKWHTNKNRGPPRPQSEIRQEAIKKQVNKYLELGVIQPSKASEYSQVHLVPKEEPNDWRFCLDYVRLNEATIGVESWPIPNIPQMIQRIGSKRPKIFGVMDMTSGYHQAPLAAAARILTAFICFMGVFEWLRVPMGAKNAGPYFQRVMTTTVLVGLLYVICELYIDDCITYGDSDEEFIQNLKQVFARFRKYNITINPKKCKFGLDKIEFVGHVISADGRITFSDEKRKKVLDFPLPTTGKKLLGFIGLVNYFRDHLPDMTGKLKRLRSLFVSLKAPVVWTPELEKHYYSVRDTVAQCPALFFPTSDGEVVVMTDASDYGIGAYIFQRVNGKERPIVFLSKALHGAQLNWSTIEKEAYAVFYTLKTYDYLLRDIPFTLKTDHKNLTYINLESSQKVRRWKLFIQDFNFKMEHVAGADNPVADAFSRLCSLSAEEEAPESTLASIQLALTQDVKIPTNEYRKIGRVHNSRVGHFGLEKTLELLNTNQEKWKHMRKHVRQFIKQCPVCQLNSDTKVLTKIPPFTRASYEPMEVLNIDTVGPLPEDEAKNKYILVIIDCFSRWVELFGIPDTSGLSAAKKLFEHCGRFGVPALIRSDRGSQFVNEIIEQLVELLDSHHEVTTAYSKEENAIVERAYKEVMRHLRAIVFEDSVYNDWSTDQLPLVMRILNSEQKTRTGVSPAEMLFGNTIDLGRYILYRPTEKPNSEIDLHAYLQRMLNRQSVLIEVAQKTQRELIHTI